MRTPGTRLLRVTSGPAAPQWLPGATGAFSVEFTALNDDVTYRPARTTFVPRILNPQTGIVTGPAGADDIYTCLLYTSRCV